MMFVLKKQKQQKTHNPGSLQSDTPTFDLLTSETTFTSCDPTPHLSTSIFVGFRGVIKTGLRVMYIQNKDIYNGNISTL